MVVSQNCLFQISKFNWELAILCYKTLFLGQFRVTLLLFFVKSILIDHYFLQSDRNGVSMKRSRNTEETFKILTKQAET